METVREHGVKSVTDVNLAIMEVYGSISVLSDKYQKKTVKKLKAHKGLTQHGA